MNKFVFSLQKVLDYKQQILDTKINELAVFQKKLLEIENEMEILDSKFKQTNQEMAVEMQAGLTRNEIQVYKLYLSSLNDKTQVLEKRQKQAAEMIAQKKQEVVAIKSEISGMEKLKEKQAREYSCLERKQQELALEEFISQQRSYVS